MSSISSIFKTRTNSIIYKKNIEMRGGIGQQILTTTEKGMGSDENFSLL